MDRLRLISPKTWYGMAKNAQKSPFVTIDWELLPQGLLGLLLPLILFVVAKHGLQLLPSLLPFVSLGSNTILPRNILGSYMVSPWACHCVLAGMAKPFVQLGQVGLRQQDFRSPPLPEAVNTLNELVATSRVIRHRRYDIYLPPNVRVGTGNDKSATEIQGKRATDSQSSSHTQKAILWFPGAGIDIVSYAPVAAQLSEGGYVVVVPSMEPFRLSQEHLGAELSSIRRIMWRVQQQLAANSRSTTVTSFEKLEWIIAGHSAGSFAAMRLAHQLHTKQQQRSRLHDTFNISSKLVMWASMYLLHYGSCLKDTSIEVLLIQADNDALVAMTKDAKDAFHDKFLPQSCVHVMVKGGTHEGFASYQSPLEEMGKISREAQQTKACRDTLKFLQK